jgi:penicillin-binding protein 1A
MAASSAYLYLAPLLPSAETYKDVQLETPQRTYTSDNRLIDEIGNRRNPIEYQEIPKVLTDALIATEDVRFYSHPGVDVQSLLRGFYGFLRGRRLGGGSTITMQLANNLSFDSDNVYLRKFKEIPFALQIQRELSKEEILTLYLNTSARSRSRRFFVHVRAKIANSHFYHFYPTISTLVGHFAYSRKVLNCWNFN